MTPPLVVGHRGAAAVAPENTLTSFVRGVADGADVLELDVHLTADGAIAVVHDATVDRVAVGGRTTGAVAELTWAQLQEVELAEGERVPTLQDVLLAVTVPVQVEVKAVAAAEPALRLVQELGVADRVTVTSFRAEALRLVRAADADVAIGVIVQEPTAAALDLVTELDAVSFHVNVAHLEADLVRSMRHRGVLVGAWPVLDDDRLDRALRAGADLVCADDPAWCRDAVARRSPTPTR